MPQLGVPELLIILVIVVIVFGVGKLPQIGGAIGQSIREFHNASKGDEKDDGDKKVTKATATDDSKDKKEETEKA